MIIIILNSLLNSLKKIQILNVQIDFLQVYPKTHQFDRFKKIFLRKVKIS